VLQKKLRPALLLSALVALGTSCATLAPSLSTLPLGAVAMTAPPVYQEWQRSTESCSGLAGDFSATKFYVVPGVNTFATEEGPKVGLWVAPGRFHAGDVVAADIGLEPVDTEHKLVTRAVLGLVPRKRIDDNKYSAGTVLVVGGSRGLTGAPCLTALAAFRADAGYVAVAAPESTLRVLEQRLLEVVKLPCPEEDGKLSERAADTILAAAQRAGAVALGPGLGRGDGPRALVRRLLREVDKPVVVDADALFELEPFERSAATILTPHSGELGRLLGVPSRDIDAHRLDAARRAADKFGAVCVLKGADTIVVEPGRGALVCGLGPASLATAGSGDVLTGVTAAFLSKGLEPRLAAAAAAAACAVAAELTGKPAGMVASDVIEMLPAALSG